ncbi:MAG: amino acid adenylation domain-containing protein [Blastocatellia bacterium]
MDNTVEGFRLSPQQKRLWLLHNEGKPAGHTTQAAYMIEGVLDTELLEVCIKDVVQRHEILRTEFRYVEGMKAPLQVITEGADSAIGHFDFSSTDAQLWQAELDRVFQAQLDIGFSFDRGSSCRFSLGVLSPTAHLLLVLLPSMCADFVTIGNLMREIALSYEAHLRGERGSREPMQYADYSEWLNELIVSGDAEIGRAYWKAMDFSSPETLRLPFQLRTARAGGFDPQRISVSIGNELTASIISLAQEHDFSLEGYLLVCWLILQRQLTGEPDIVIGAQLDGRRYEQLEEALGLFAGYAPISGHIEDGCTIRDLIGTVSEQMKAARKWQEYLFWQRAEEANSTPPFSIVFDCQEAPSMQKAGETTFSLYRHYYCFDQFALRLSCLARKDSISAEIHFDSSAFRLEAARLIADQYQALLASVCEDLDAPIDQVSLVDVEQSRSEFNKTATEYSIPDGVHCLIEKQAESAPDRIAVVFEEHQVSYCELNRRANQLARHLIRLGVGPEIPAAICLEQSIESVIGLLGTMKAGGAYMPLSPALPAERLAAIIAATQAPVVLSLRAYEETVERLPALAVYLDSDWQAGSGESGQGNSGSSTRENLAYLLFTSGSTGLPKAVAVEHRQLINYVQSVSERLELSEAKRFALVSSFTTDLGNTAVFPSLCFGKTLHVISRERAMDAEAMAAYFEQREIDVLKIVPSHLDALFGSNETGATLPLKRLIIGGEALRWDLVCRVLDAAKDCRVFNHYGPTETTVGVMTCKIDRHSLDDTAMTVPVGRPLPNCEAYLLNDSFYPVATGVTGEIFIGGLGLARGYLNQPDLTAERFLPNPIARKPGSRIYRTGDLARFLLSREVEFIGRRDYQVKIRGYRIELGEIEAALNQHPALRASVVVAGNTDEKQLIAYVVTSEKQPLIEREIYGWLRARLPDYMIPAMLIPLDGLPLGPSGKLDRRLLPPPVKQQEVFVSPRTPVEAVLAGIWAEVLGVDKVGADDDFFRLGGDSLTAIRITSKIRKTFQMELLPRSLFEAPTVGHLAELMTSRETKPGQVVAIARLRQKVDSMSAAEMQSMLQNTASRD